MPVFCGQKINNIKITKLKRLDYILIGTTVAVVTATILVYRRIIAPRANGKKANGSILFIGDSISYGPASYAALIKKMWPNRVVDVLAKEGANTSWMLANLKSTLVKNKYDSVVVYGGINDVFGGLSEQTSLANIQAMVDIAINQGAKAYVIPGYDAKTFMTNLPAAKWPLALKYANLQYLMATQIKNATILPLITLQPSQTSDGIHPNANAQAQISDEVMKYLG